MTKQSPLLGIYLDKTIILKDACIPVFIAALFTIAKTWKQPKCPSTDEQKGIYSAIKGNEIGSFVETLMDLETIIQSEVSHKEKSKYHILMHICVIQKNHIDELIYKAEIETQTQRTNIWIPRGEGGWNELRDWD